jgi:hypothetical protein
MGPVQATRRQVRVIVVVRDLVFFSSPVQYPPNPCISG